MLDRVRPYPNLGIRLDQSWATAGEACRNEVTKTFETKLGPRFLTRHLKTE